MPYKDPQKRKDFKKKYHRERYQNESYWTKRNQSRLKKLEMIAGRERPATCEVCGSGQGLIVFDHNHSTGKFRGWICIPCNKTLGTVHDDPAVLLKLADYLKNNQDDSPPLKQPVKVNDLLVGVKSPFI